MALRFSTGCCNRYRFGGTYDPHDLGGSIPGGHHFQYWYKRAGFAQFSGWENKDVWRTDFIDAHAGDLVFDGGSDVPEVYYYQGHGAPGQLWMSAGAVDMLHQSIWGNGRGKLQFLFLMACSTMPLEDLPRWVRCFQGLHMAIGNSKRIADSISRGAEFAAYTAGAGKFAPRLSVGDAWMRTGLKDAEEGCSAIAISAGSTKWDAEDRGAHERVTDNRPKPRTTWVAWRWVTKPF